MQGIRGAPASGHLVSRYTGLGEGSLEQSLGGPGASLFQDGLENGVSGERGPFLALSPPAQRPHS